MLFRFSARKTSAQPKKIRMGRSLGMREWFIKDWEGCVAPSLVLRNSADKSNNERLRSVSSVVFPFGVRLALLASVRLPGLRDHVRMNPIRVLHGLLALRKPELSRIAKPCPPFFPLRPPHH